MRVVERKVVSSSDPNDDHPWYELTFDEEAGTVRIMDEADGGLDATITNSARAVNDSTPAFDGAPSFDDATPVDDVSPTDDSEPPVDVSATSFTAANESESDRDRIWAVTMDGELIVYTPSSSGIPPLRAHLAWYDSKTDTLEMLKFVEP